MFRMPIATGSVVGPMISPCSAAGVTLKSTTSALATPTVRVAVAELGRYQSAGILSQFKTERFGIKRVTYLRRPIAKTKLPTITGKGIGTPNGIGDVGTPMASRTFPMWLWMVT